MKSKLEYIFLAAISMLFSLSHLSAESPSPYITLMDGTGAFPGDRDVSIPAGYVVEVISMKTITDEVNLQSSPSIYNYSRVEISGTNWEVFFNETNTPNDLPTFLGPLQVSVRAEAGEESFCFVALKVTPVPSEIVRPSNTVVIPEEPNGNYRIILESSTDLVTWTEALPGEYGSSTSKRFFRLRAETLN